MRYTTAEKEAMANAIKNNDYETYKRYLPSAYSEQAKQSAFARAGGTLSTTSVTTGGTEGSTPTTPTTPTQPTTPTTPTTPTPPSSNEATTNGGDEAVANEDFSAKYRGDSFLDWYKSNYGNDYDSASGSPNFAGLNGVDGAIGQSLYNYYQLQKNAEENHTKQAETIKSGYDSTLDKLKTQYDSDTQLLLDRYGNATEALDKSKSNSQQSASITLDKLKKYLPTQIKAQGLGGLGVSESTMLQAHNNYNNQMGEIEANYNTQKSAVDTNFNENKASYDNTYNTSTADINAEKESRLAELLNNYSEKAAEYKVGAGADSSSIFDAYKNKYETQQEQLRQEKLAKDEADRQNAYTVAQATVEDLIYTQKDYTKAKEYLESNKSTFGDSVYTSYMTALNAEKQKEDTAKAEEDKTNTDTRILEGKEYVSYNGANYQIKSQLNGDSNEIKRNNDFKKQLQNAFGTSNPYDSKIPNGTTFAVKADNRGSNDFNWWDDVGAALLSPLMGGAWDSWGNWNTVYMTYYNGNWYKSEKK